MEELKNAHARSISSGKVAHATSTTSASLETPRPETNDEDEPKSNRERNEPAFTDVVTIKREELATLVNACQVCPIMCL